MVVIHIYLPRTHYSRAGRVVHNPYFGFMEKNLQRDDNERGRDVEGINSNSNSTGDVIQKNLEPRAEARERQH